MPSYILYSSALLYICIYFSIFTLKFSKKIFFGLFLFLITVLPSSGIMPTGIAPVADRYTYIPYIGLSYLIANLLYVIYTRKKYLSIFAIGIIAVFLFSITYQRNILWKDYINLMTQAIEYSPDKAGYAYLNRGIAYKANNELDLAEKDLTKSYSINKQNTYIVFHLASLRQLQKKFSEAKKLYYRIPIGSFDYIDTVANLGLIFSEENKGKIAIKNMNEIINKNTSIPDYFYHILSHIYYKEKMLDEAIETIKKAIKENPSAPAHYIKLMDFFNEKNNPVDFEKTAVNGLKNTDNNIEILNKLILFYFKNKKYLKLEELSMKSINLYPANHLAYFMLGNLSAISFNYDKALFFYTLAIISSKGIGEYYFKRAVVWYMFKNYDQAKKDIEKAEKHKYVVDKLFIKDLEKIKKS
jgi:tetratricopeptide (TPR) repeat protein